MTYNPTPDRSAEIIANAGNNAAQITAQGNANFQNQLTSSFNTAMSGIKQNYNKSQETALMKEGNMGTGAALESIFKTYGTTEQYQNFITGWDKNAGNATREAGFLSGQQVIGNSLMQMAQQNNQYKQAGILAGQKAALGGGSNPALSVEVADGIDLGW